jgi:oligoendopeptidase F
MTPEHLSALMVQAQKQAFLNSLEEYNPYFWISKEHFYITSVPFYNFPYTFGYFFSLGIYAQLGKSVEFENKYLSLLRDTGVMAVEDLAKKHLNEDLSLPHFWQKSVDLAKKDVTRFLEISK